jgi:hypothetical protein
MTNQTASLVVLAVAPLAACTVPSPMGAPAADHDAAPSTPPGSGERATISFTFPDGSSQAFQFDSGKIDCNIGDVASQKEGCPGTGYTGGDITGAPGWLELSTSDVLAAAASDHAYALTYPAVLTALSTVAGEVSSHYACVTGDSGADSKAMGGTGTLAFTSRGPDPGDWHGSATAEFQCFDVTVSGGPSVSGGRITLTF